MNSSWIFTNKVKIRSCISLHFSAKIQLLVVRKVSFFVKLGFLWLCEQQYFVKKNKLGKLQGIWKLCFFFFSHKVKHQGISFISSELLSREIAIMKMSLKEMLFATNWKISGCSSEDFSFSIRCCYDRASVRFMP